MAGYDNTSPGNFTVNIGDTDNNLPPPYNDNYSRPTGNVPPYNEFQFVSGNTNGMTIVDQHENLILSKADEWRKKLSEIVVLVLSFSSFSCPWIE